jgi:hypothetical protein
VRYERVAARVEHCSAIGEHKTRSGGRQPAVCSVRRTMSAVCRRSLASAFPNPRLAHASRSWSQTRMLLPVCVSYPRVRCPSTAGLRQPLLIADADAFAGVRFIPAITPLISRLAHASRSWTERVGCTKAMVTARALPFARQRSHSQFVSPQTRNQPRLTRLHKVSAALAATLLLASEQGCAPDLLPRGTQVHRFWHLAHSF